MKFSGFLKPEESDPNLILPVFDILFPFLPEKIRFKLRFGVRHGQNLALVTIDLLDRVKIVQIFLFT